MPQETYLDNIELDAQNTDSPLGAETLRLPQADGGWAAWLFLTGSFTIEMLIWGKNSLQYAYVGSSPLSGDRVSILVRCTARLLQHT
jgi:hypothetical protein